MLVPELSPCATLTVSVKTPTYSVTSRGLPPGDIYTRTEVPKGRGTLGWFKVVVKQGSTILSVNVVDPETDV